ITSVGGVLPARYCEGTTADLLLYGQPVEKNDTNLWQHDSLCPVAPFPRAALVVPAGGDPATDGFPLPAGTCGFQCQLDEAQHPLALHPSKLIQLFGLSGTGPFTILETPITLQSLADMISAAGPLVDLPVPIVAGVDDTTIVPAGSDAGTILPGDESTETTIAQTETFDAATAPFDPGLPIGDPGLEYVETPANSSGGTEKPGVITAVTGDGADGLGSGIGGVGPVGGCTLMFRTAR
ncbi:MAG: hypothetical protein HYV02_08585, partial [Deltaproteobacteria bacterium]|nr:hypothetical protein [Deltaproteobacteria bacterium]